jgi:cellobiose phosphorylase
MSPLSTEPPGVGSAVHAYLLSNGRYRAVVTDRGIGYSAWGDVALTRWVPDPHAHAGGVVFYVRDLDLGRFWSTARRAIGEPPSSSGIEAIPGLVTSFREDHQIETRQAVGVAPDRDVEYRVLTLTNRGATSRRLEVTTYVEVALNDPALDAAHPAFSKLFVQTELSSAEECLLARRRRRSPEDPPLWMGHGLWREGGRADLAQVETDRMRFIGRGRNLDDPAALDAGAALSGSVGTVLDPIFSLRREVTLGAGRSARLVGLVAAGPSRAKVMACVTARAALRWADVTRDAEAAERTRLERLGLASHADRIPSLTGALLFGAAAAATSTSLPAAAGVTLGDLCALGLRGSAALVLAHLRGETDRADLDVAARLLVWWRQGGLPVDLLVLEDGVQADMTTLPDGAVVRRAADLSAHLRTLVTRAARLTLAQLGHAAPAPRAAVTSPARCEAAGASAAERHAALPGAEALQFYNGYGGFTADGSEYVIRLPWTDGRIRLPPRPWTNVIANETLGCIVSERGVGCTWSVNSRQNRLTPWNNDPVTDPAGEALFLRDEERAVFWTPTPGPAGGPGDYEVRHGFGYTVWRHRSLELEHETVVFVPRRDAVKVTRVRVTNRGARRRVSLYAYLRWVLGELPERDGRFVVTVSDPDSRAILAAQPYRGAAAGRVAFACLVPPVGALSVEQTGDRASFIGAGGEGAPDAVAVGGPLDGRTGASLDACAGFRASLELAAGATAECLFLVGEGADREAALGLCRRYGRVAAVDAALEEVKAFWNAGLGRLRVATPLPALDCMVNGWLAYQALSCRMWGRSAFYQSGGAYGFRDQLQDSAALVWLWPDLTRAQLLRHAARQFREGDVLHWWHPPLGLGMRTRFTDDPVWLPFVATEYVHHTGDEDVLDEPVAFLEAPPLPETEDHVLLVPRDSGERGSLYEHCCRSLDRALTRGTHGLPLMGSGDWNDGMNRVGRAGRGESVWLGFFLYDVLLRFLPWTERRGDRARAERYRAYCHDLGRALNESGWDGAWYRRAFYDNGHPLGSALSDECRIDAIAQAWAVLSGAAPLARADQAMDALERHLVDARAGIIRLLTPPFDHTPDDPGYIKGYLPGVRENGGQYTHGVLWAVRAMAELGRGERAATLLEMLNPISHTGSPQAVPVYQAEPYVMAADVYGVPPHVGRAGWTWYTGSAGWMLRVAVESILGLTLEDGKALLLRPCLPASWPGFSLRYELPGTGTVYALAVEQSRPRAPRTEARVDGSPLEVRAGAVRIPILADGRIHRVDVRLGGDVGPRYVPRVPGRAPAD